MSLGRTRRDAPPLRKQLTQAATLVPHRRSGRGRVPRVRFHNKGGVMGLNDGDSAAAQAVRTKRVAERAQVVASRLQAKHKAAMVIAELLPIDRAKVDDTFRTLRDADERRLKSADRKAKPPARSDLSGGRSAPFDLVWQTEVPPGGSFYGPDAQYGLVGSNVSADMGHSASMGNSVGFRYYAQETRRLIFEVAVVDIQGWVLASGVFGSAQVEGSCTIQIQEEDGGADIGSWRNYFLFAAAGPFIRDERWFDDWTCSVSVAANMKAGKWYQVWSAMDFVLASQGAAYAGVDCQGYVQRFDWRQG
jgi:hypothetical protein